MAKETAILLVGIMTLALVGYAGYGFYTDTIPLSKSATAQVTDYTTELQSIQTSLSQINAKLETLESDTMKELEQIKLELAQVKTTELTTPEPSIFEITTNNSIYSKGGQIQITGQGADAQRPIKLEMFSSFGELITSKTAYSDSMGNLAYVFEVPTYIQTGNYSIKATSNGKVDSESISITSNVILNNSESSTSIITYAGLTMILDKNEYSPGDIVRISGTGQVSMSVDLKVTDPDATVTASHSSTNSKGAYTLIYILPSDAKTGNWKMIVSQDSEEESITLKVLA